MTNWYLIRWLVWMAVFLGPVLFLPWVISRAWMHQHGALIQAGPRSFFAHGELGLLSVILASSVIWNLFQSEFTPHTTSLGAIVLALAGIMALCVWVECYCRQIGQERCDPERVWRDSRSLSICVFSVATVVQILLDRLQRVVTS